MDAKLITRVSYSDIFNDSETITSLLKKSNVNKSLIMLAILNKYEYKLRDKPNSEIKFIIDEWLINSAKPLKEKVINTFANFIKKNQRRNQPKIDISSVSIINRIATLRLLEIFSSKSGVSKEDTKTDNNEILFRLYLLVNKEIGERQDKVFKKLFSKRQTVLDEIYSHLFLGLTHVDLSQKSVSKRLISEVLKFIQFEKWLRTIPDYHEMSKEYLLKINLGSWYEYFSDIFSINNITINNHRINSKDYPSLKKTLDFMLSSNENYDTIDWGELSQLRKNPITKIDDYYLILDSNFTLDKFFSSLYHDLLNFSKKRFDNKFHQDYNKLFVEEILLLNSIKSAIGKSYVQYSEQDIKQHSTKGIQNLSLPDYYIRNGKKVFLFECKNSYLSNNNKIELNIDNIINEIKSKFYFDKTKGKAVKQFIKFISNSNLGKYSFYDDIKKPKNLEYYPILVVTDYTLCSIGFNQLLNEFLSIELKELNNTLSKRVRNLTIIHIDDFLYYNNKLKKLEQLINKYHRYLNIKDGFDSMLSFSDYIGTIEFREREYQ